MSVFLSNPRRLANEALAEIMTPPPPVDYEAWANRYGVIVKAREHARAFQHPPHIA